MWRSIAIIIKWTVANKFDELTIPSRTESIMLLLFTNWLTGVKYNNVNPTTVKAMMISEMAKEAIKQFALLWSAGVRHTVTTFNTLINITQQLSINPIYTTCIRCGWFRTHIDVTLYIVSSHRIYLLRM